MATAMASVGRLRDAATRDRGMSSGGRTIEMMSIVT